MGDLDVVGPGNALQHPAQEDGGVPGQEEEMAAQGLAQAVGFY